MGKGLCCGGPSVWHTRSFKESYFSGSNGDFAHWGIATSCTLWTVCCICVSLFEADLPTLFEVARTKFSRSMFLFADEILVAWAGLMSAPMLAPVG